MKPHKTSEGHILMKKRGARLFQQGDGSSETNWNIVELDSRRQLRQKVNELIRLSYDSTTTTSEMQQQLLQAWQCSATNLLRGLCVRFKATIN